MHKIITFLLLNCFICSSYAQNIFDVELDSVPPKKSKLTLGTQFTNSTFAISNPGINSISTVKKLITAPYITYDHKSGLSITARASANNDGFFQLAIAPAYSLINNDVEFNIGYEKTFVNNYSNPYINIFQNDFSTYFTYLKKWVQPGISINVANGKYTESYTTTIKKRIPLFMPLRDTLINVIIKDTAKNKINNVNASFYLQHAFYWDGVISKNDYVDFTPSILLNAGNQKIKTSTTSTNANPRVRNRKPLASTATYKEKFALQSIGVALNTTYAIKNFFINTQIYIDQYIATSGNKPAAFFTLGVGVVW